jgi:hypothetical protein
LTKIKFKDALRKQCADPLEDMDLKASRISCLSLKSIDFAMDLKEPCPRSKKKIYIYIYIYVDKPCTCTHPLHWIANFHDIAM